MAEPKRPSKSVQWGAAEADRKIAPHLPKNVVTARDPETGLLDTIIDREHRKVFLVHRHRGRAVRFSELSGTARAAVLARHGSVT